MSTVHGDTGNRQEEVAQAIQGNLETVLSFSRREEEMANGLQRVIERVSPALGHPVYFVVFILFCASWIAADLIFAHFKHNYFDEPPFFWLQGIVAFNGVLITMAVLVRQNRLARTEEKRAHLELQVNLLAEQKATKIIQLLEELRLDMPGVKNRLDPEAKAMQEATDPEVVLHALETQQRKTTR